MWKIVSQVLPVLYSHEHYTYTYTCRNIFNTIKMSGHSSLEKYTSHFIWKGSKGLLKVLLCERWVGDWTEQQHIDPHSYGHNSFSFPFSWAAQPGAWGPSLSGTWSSFQHLLSNWPELQLQLLVLSTASYLQQIWTFCRRGYIIIWRPLFFLWASQFHTQFNPSTVKVISWYSSTGCTCYLHRCISYFDSSAGVNMQHQSTVSSRQQVHLGTWEMCVPSSVHCHWRMMAVM